MNTAGIHSGCRTEGTHLSAGPATIKSPCRISSDDTNRIFVQTIIVLKITMSFHDIIIYFFQ